ncbi:hypothetical protein [Acetomicrobium mobile]|uniref:hypothetical protein n=1 Tax=Acetomicrobium mobile TaxID=97477 RepID=UPI0026E97F33|nr:hypothetical protein [Acetomicrobium mobile]
MIKILPPVHDPAGGLLLCPDLPSADLVHRSRFQCNTPFGMTSTERDRIKELERENIKPA